MVYRIEEEQKYFRVNPNVWDDEYHEKPILRLKFHTFFWVE
jgi:hypothetical protein